MHKTKLHALAGLGQAVWLDYIRRSLMTSGKLEEYVRMGLRGLTSNPAIFEKAISGSDDYEEDLQRLVEEDKSVEEIYEALAMDDIRRAADVLRPVYEADDPAYAGLNRGDDGYVSLEVSPALAHDTDATIAEARRLFQSVDRPNVMIKVPATAAGFPAIEQLIAEGVNVNVTLMFSLEQYDRVADAYMRGLERRLKQGEELRGVASVASFFVSRVDVKVDAMLDELDRPEAVELRGKIGIANAKMAYQRFTETLQSARWSRLAEEGARVQRVLFGSTSTKDPAYPDTLYADNLIGPQTVNTLPPDTIAAFLDHGAVAPTLTSDLIAARAHLDALGRLGIDLDKVTHELLDEGVKKFADPFNELLDAIRAKCAALQPGEKTHA